MLSSKSEAANETTNKSLFIDVHDLEPGKVTFADVLAAHQKDLATEGKYDVSFIKFWVDEKKEKYIAFHLQKILNPLFTHMPKHMAYCLLQLSK